MNLRADTFWLMTGRHWLLGTLLSMLLGFVAPAAVVAGGMQKNFESPEAAVDALVTAVKANDAGKLQAILGSHSQRLIDSGDAVADAQRREAFVKEYSEANKIVRDGDSRATLLIGDDEWPLPIPIVKAGNRWRFDTRQGEREILARRIGRNELAAIQVGLAIVDAENEYAEQVRDADGSPRYAARLVSTRGKQDGLYWETAAGERSSPLGPLLASAAAEGYASSPDKPLAPYHGYYYRILTKQGKDAPGGAYDYIVKGRLIGGFAVLAWPARYGSSGVMTFMIDHDGVVYENDLGRYTTVVAGRIDTFNPGAGWTVQKSGSE